MKPNQFPISTALSDPKWFHDFQNSHHTFRDKKGVVNGMRFEIFNPQTAECVECKEKTFNCAFKQSYRKYLNSLNFTECINKIETHINNIAQKLNVDNPEVILLVHEAPTNPCSERAILQEWFINNDSELPEWQPK